MDENPQCFRRLNRHFEHDPSLTQAGPKQLVVMIFRDAALDADYLG